MGWPLLLTGSKWSVHRVRGCCKHNKAPFTFPCTNHSHSWIFPPNILLLLRMKVLLAWIASYVKEIQYPAYLCRMRRYNATSEGSILKNRRKVLELLNQEWKWKACVLVFSLYATRASWKDIKSRHWKWWWKFIGSLNAWQTKRQHNLKKHFKLWTNSVKPT